MTIFGVGLQGSLAHVSFTTGLTETCAYSVLYYDVTSDAGKAMYTLLLTARVSGKTLTRVDYTKDAAGVCYLEFASI